MDKLLKSPMFISIVSLIVGMLIYEMIVKPRIISSGMASEDDFEPSGHTKINL